MIKYRKIKECGVGGHVFMYYVMSSIKQHGLCYQSLSGELHCVANDALAHVKYHS